MVAHLLKNNDNFFNVIKVYLIKKYYFSKDFLVKNKKLKLIWYFFLFSQVFLDKKSKRKKKKDYYPDFTHKINKQTKKNCEYAKISLYDCHNLETQASLTPFSLLTLNLHQYYYNGISVLKWNCPFSVCSICNQYSTSVTIIKQGLYTKSHSKEIPK